MAVKCLIVQAPDVKMRDDQKRSSLLKRGVKQTIYSVVPKCFLTKFFGKFMLKLF
jgi:hypothetical protein